MITDREPARQTTALRDLDAEAGDLLARMIAEPDLEQIELLIRRDR